MLVGKCIGSSKVFNGRESYEFSLLSKGINKTISSPED